MARTLPTVIGLGGMRCGSTSLHRYLCQHPQLLGPTYGDQKEVHYFDVEINRPDSTLNWYRECWPEAPEGVVRIESTPEYLTYPGAVMNIVTRLPNAKFILLLRDPVERAYSHFKIRVATKEEQLGTTFEDALLLENQRIVTPLDMMKSGQALYNHLPFTFGYRYQGLYASHLERWLKEVDLSRFFITRSEDFFAETKMTLHRIVEWLDLNDFHGWDTTTISRGLQHTEPMAPITRERLQRYFDPQNKRLAELLYGPDSDTLWPY